jgi:hypothetical protein
MGMQLNTGDTGRAVSPAADGSLYSKIFGSGCYVLSGGNELKAEIQSNNLIKIYDGDLIMQGRHSYIPASDSDNVTVNNGSQGMNRKDLIVARYTKDSTGVEDVTLQVVQGTATSGTATAPGYTDGDILKGATAKDFPLYEVSLTGINITEVKKLFKVLGTNAELSNKLTELNGNISITANGICKKYNNGIMEQYIKVDRNTSAWSAWKYMYYAEVAAVDYLEPFKDITYLNIYLQSNNVAVGQMALDDGTLAKTPTMYALRPDTANPLTVTVYVHAIGKWK